MFARAASLSALAIALAAPAASPAAVLHFKGRATGEGHDRNMVITFDLRSGKGRPQTLSNVSVTRLDYACLFGGPAERDLRLRGHARFTAGNRFELREKEAPPLYANDLYGRFHYPKKGGFRRPTITGKLISEVGYGDTRSTYNCTAFERFTAWRVR